MTVQRTFFDWANSGLDWDRAPYEQCAPNTIAGQAWLKDQIGGGSLGCHLDRNIRQGLTISEHAYGAAGDWDYADNMRAAALEAVRFMIDHSAEFGIVAIHDYVGDRIWRAGRTDNANDRHGSWWRDQNGRGSGMGEAWATYFHVVTSREKWADGSPWASRLGSTPTFPPVSEYRKGVPQPTVTEARLSGPETNAVALRGVLAFWGWETIAEMQQAIGAEPDGTYGPKSAVAYGKFLDAMEAYEPAPDEDCPWPMPDSDGFREGDSSLAVAAVQQQLNAARAAWAGTKLDDDGRYGPKTAAEVRRAQTWLRSADRYSGQASGVYDRATRAALCVLDDDLAALKANRPCTLPAPPLKQGDQGARVTALQRWLTSHGIPTAADGRYGPITSQKVQKLQRQSSDAGFNPGPIDGQYGSRTHAAGCELETRGLI